MNPDQNGQLSYPANQHTQAAIQGAISSYLNAGIMDFFWNNFFHFYTCFDNVITYPAITGMGVSVNTNGTASSTVTNGSNVLTLITGTANGGYAQVSKSPTYNSFLSFVAPSYMRSAFSVDSGTSLVAYIVRGNSATKNYGFKIQNGVLQGVVNNGTSEQVVNLATPSFTTIAPSGIYSVAAKFYPESKCLFYVNGIEAGVITSGLPTGSATASDPNLYDIKATNTSSVSKQLALSFLEIVQKKVIPSRQ